MRGKLAAVTLTALAVATAPASYADPGSDFLVLLGKYNLNLSTLMGKPISSQDAIQLGQDICGDLHSGTPVTTVVNEIYRDMPNITDKQAGNLVAAAQLAMCPDTPS